MERAAVPHVGTFYLLSQEQGNSGSPPFPFNPYFDDSSVAVYLLDAGQGIYLVADRPELYAALEQQDQMQETKSALLNATAQSFGLATEEDSGGGLSPQFDFSTSDL